MDGSYEGHMGTKELNIFKQGKPDAEEIFHLAQLRA